jgi:uncharacterized protein (TIGR03435 family)
MTFRFCLALTLFAPTFHAQVRSAFEVASVKQNRECTQGPPNRMPTPGRLHLECMSLRELIHVAFVAVMDGATVNMAQMDILGLPAWAESDRFDIEAKADGLAPVGQMAGPMLQALLEERFNLAIHREIIEASGYKLTIGANGPKIAPTPDGSCIKIDLNNLPQRKPGSTPQVFCGQVKTNLGPHSFTVIWTGMTVSEFASSLSKRARRPIVDKTGLAGRYDFQIEIPRDESTYVPDPASVLARVQEQLGLKLVAEKGSASRLIVDRVEKLTEK